MLAKIIYKAPDRLQAIEGLNAALDEYVVDGVQHNANLVQSVLRNAAFQAGDAPTSFLETHYPDGFHGVELTTTEEEDLGVAAAVIDSVRGLTLERPNLIDFDEEEQVVVVSLGGMFGGGPSFRVSLNLLDRVAEVCSVSRGAAGNLSFGNSRMVKLDESAYDPNETTTKFVLDGNVHAVQLLKESPSGEYRMKMHGADLTVIVQSEREFQLSGYMHEPPVLDTSSMVLSPMPGTLISVAVEEGDEVQDGQELCVIEAMKMQNIIRSPRHAVIGELKVKVGSSLKADQAILTFQQDQE